MIKTRTLKWEKEEENRNRLEYSLNEGYRKTTITEERTPNGVIFTMSMQFDGGAEISQRYNAQTDNLAKEVTPDQAALLERDLLEKIRKSRYLPKTLRGGVIGLASKLEEDKALQ